MKFLYSIMIVQLVFALPLSNKCHCQVKENVQDVEMPLYMLTYDHGGLILWGSDHFRERLRNAINWLDKYPGFKIGLDNEAYVYDYLSDNEPDLLQEMKGYLEKYEGRFGIGTCTYGQPLSTFIGGESNIRQIGYALESNKKHFNYNNSIYLMSEHAMHAQIPQIIDGFGFKGAIMRTHFMMYGYNPEFDEPFGWWVGLDGTRIPTVPTYKGEGAEFGKTPIDNWILTRYPGPECDISLRDFKNQFKNITPLLATRADDSGLRREELVKQYEGKPGYRWILLDEMLSLYPEPQAEFITRPNDFKVRMPWGYCGNEIWNTSRKAEVQALIAERLNAVTYLLKGEDHEANLHDSWKHLLLAQHHDVQIVGLLPDARQHLEISMIQSNKVIDASFGYLTEQIKGEGIKQVTVFNPLSWPRKDWIETSVNFVKGEAKDITVKNNGVEVPSVIIEANRFSDGSILEGRVLFEAASSGFGLRNYSLIPESTDWHMTESNISVDYDKLHIITPVLDIWLDEQGGFKSLTDRRTGKKIFINSRRSAFFEGLINGQEETSKGRWIIEEGNDNSPWVIAREYGFIADIPYIFRIKVFENSPTIECSVSFSFNGQKIGQLSNNVREDVSPFIHEKKLRFKFFPDLKEKPVGVRDLPFAIAETNDRYIEGNFWTAVSDNHNGIAVFNKGNMCLVRENDGGYSIPLSYAMYYIWGTRMLKGDYNYEFAIHPFNNDWKKADLHRKAITYNFPVLHRSSVPGVGSIKDQIEFIDIGSDNVIMSAFYTEDGKVITRMYESQGKSSEVPVNVLMNYQEIHEIDLAGNKVDEFKERIRFNPWQIKTIQIEFQD